MNIEKIVVGYLETNCYIVSKNNKCLIIDPGDDFQKIDSFLMEKKYKPIAILITHYHFDHIGALQECEKKYDIPVIDSQSNKNQKIEDFNFEILSTLGHKEDSVSFYFKNEKIIFVGDFVFKSTIGRIDLEGGNAKDMIDSIKKIKTFSDDIKLYPGHGEETTLGEEKKFNPYFIKEQI